jgi:pyridoxal phosphate enzyme (YggS family)
MILASIMANLAAINDRIARAAAKADRDPATITLIGVSKTVDRDVVDAAIEAGVRVLGENRVQDAQRKFALPLPPGVTLHMIGQLQSNKAGQAVDLFDVIESVDRVSLIKELDRQALKRGDVIPVLLQVNVARESQKAGCDPEDAVSLARAIRCAEGLRLEGLMTIAPLVDDPEAVRPVFSGARELRDNIIQDGVADCLPVLSMGMTNDFDIAIEEGATHIRVGRALFTI